MWLYKESSVVRWEIMSLYKNVDRKDTFALDILLNWQVTMITSLIDPRKYLKVPVYYTVWINFQTSSLTHLLVRWSTSPTSWIRYSHPFFTVLRKKDSLEMVNNIINYDVILVTFIGSIEMKLIRALQDRRVSSAVLCINNLTL